MMWLCGYVMEQTRMTGVKKDGRVRPHESGSIGIEIAIGFEIDFTTSVSGADILGHATASSPDQVSIADMRFLFRIKQPDLYDFDSDPDSDFDHPHPI